MDPPLILYLSRLIRRTFRRMLGWEPPCSEGCNETYKTFFSRENIIWFGLNMHKENRRRQLARMSRIGLGVGTDVDNRRMRRIGGWGRQLEQWIVSVQNLMMASESGPSKKYI